MLLKETVKQRRCIKRNVPSTTKNRKSNKNPDNTEIFKILFSKWSASNNSHAPWKVPVAKRQTHDFSQRWLIPKLLRDVGVRFYALQARNLNAFFVNHLNMRRVKFSIFDDHFRIWIYGVCCVNLQHTSRGLENRWWLEGNPIRVEFILSFAYCFGGFFDRTFGFPFVSFDVDIYGVDPWF